MPNPKTGKMLTMAGKYATTFGFKDRITEGLGAEYRQSLLSNAFKRISQSGMSAMSQGGMSINNSGMQFSGLGIKSRNSVIGNIASQSMDAVNKVNQQDQEYKLNAERTWLQILQHEDNFNIQQQQLDLQKPDIWDKIGSIGALLSSGVSLASGIG